ASPMPTKPPPSVRDSPLAVSTPVAKILTSRPATTLAEPLTVALRLLWMSPSARESPTSMNAPPALEETEETLGRDWALMTMSLARTVEPPLMVALTLAVAKESDWELRTEMAPPPTPDEVELAVSSPL